MHNLETIEARNRGQVLAEALLADAQLAERIRRANPDVFPPIGQAEALTEWQDDGQYEEWQDDGGESGGA